MTRARGILLTTTVSILTFCTATVTEAYVPDLISHWQFDENGGSIAVDAVGNRHGSIYGANYVPGKLGSALYFDGNDYVLLPQNSLDNVGPEMTISLWVYRHRTGVQETMFAYANNSGGDYYLQTVFSSSDQLIFSVRKSSSSYMCSFVGTRPMDSGRWYHIVFSQSPSNVRMYVDGMEDHAFPHTNNNCSGAWGIPAVANYAEMGSFGALVRNTTGYYLNGMIDEVKLFSAS